MLKIPNAIIATMDITEERKKKVDFTQKYQHIPARFAAKKGTEIQLDKAFMDGKTIAVQRATSMDTYITDNFPNATIDATKLTWNPSAGGSNYRTLLESALAEGSGRTWVTESTVSPGDPQLDPIVAATSSYRNACRQLGTVLVPCDEPGSARGSRPTR